MNARKPYLLEIQIAALVPLVEFFLDRCPADPLEVGAVLIGDATIAATKAMAPKDVVKEMSNRRLDYYRELPNGILLRDRTSSVEKIALEMIEAERSTTASSA